jgi:transcriptional regulator with XRE-family HTH domain
LRIGHILKRYKEIKEKTNEDMANRLGCSVDHYRHLENGSLRACLKIISDIHMPILKSNF